jgi:hypothetical protein
MPVTLVVTLASPQASAQAAECVVPGDHATVQDAAADHGCDPITLADLTYSESVRIERSVSITGPVEVAEIAGLVEVAGPGTLVQLSNLRVDNGCAPEALISSSGGQVVGDGLEVVGTAGGPCPPVTFDLLFADGFESGDTSAWTAVARPSGAN